VKNPSFSIRPFYYCRHKENSPFCNVLKILSLFLIRDIVSLTNKFHCSSPHPVSSACCLAKLSHELAPSAHIAGSDVLDYIDGHNWVKRTYMVLPEALFEGS
jgi:hypothetical protein